MGEHAQDTIDAGMMEERPFGPPRRRTRYRRVQPNSVLKPTEPPPPSVDDDHFTWWYDSLMAEPGSDRMSVYEIAGLAWEEAVKRMREAKR